MSANILFDFGKKPTIKDCPCCGGKPYLHHENLGRTVWVQCIECGIQTPKYDEDDIASSYSGAQKAIKTWNRRPNDKQPKTCLMHDFRLYGSDYENDYFICKKCGAQKKERSNWNREDKP